ncbi:MAG: hypothetical protein QG625_2810 [Cyanobacteriota bacterium erpe_2018_sw_39hr_WHONDRS-SW48-000098_B_bin.30]|jgi:hypothetical protein|nr:hypothetical protein [Cyanobacteriota bacterium erpe_2018_sw_39hr_WHONDRS-SW48-000098_B_bin.30]
MRFRNVLTKIFLLLVSFGVCPNAVIAQSTSSVQMKILAINHRLSQDYDKSGVVTLRFLNRGKSQVAICLSGELSFGGYGVLESAGIKPKPSLFYARPGAFRSFGAVLSTVDYKWSTLDGSEVVTGTYDISMPAQILESGKDFKLRFPIKLPSTPGTYNFDVHFDNREMLRFHSARSTTLESSRRGCFEASSREKVTIPTPKEEQEFDAYFHR